MADGAQTTLNPAGAPATPHMAPAPVGHLLFGAVAVGILGLLVAFGPGMADPHQLGRPVPARAIGYSALAVVWLSVATLEWARGHRRTGAEILGVAAVVGLGTLIVTREPLSYTLGSMVTALGAPLGIAVLLRYPEVRLRRASDRLPIVLAAVAAATSVPLHLFYAPHLYGCPDCPPDVNVLFLQHWEAGVATSLAVGGAAFVASLGALIIVAVRRYRAAGPVARRVVGPVTAAAVIFAVGGLTFLLGQNTDVEDLGPMQSLDGLGAIGFLVTAGAAPLALLVARARERSLVGQLGELAGPLDAAALELALQRLVGDPELQVGVADPDGGYRDVAGQPLQLPDPTDGPRTVTPLGESVGVLVHDATLARERSLLDAVVVVAGLALHNQILAEEVSARLQQVRASRTRLVEASDAARRQVERDLHDGAQQRIVTTALHLRTVQQAVLTAQAGDGQVPPHLSTELEQAIAELEEGLRELRDLAHGMFPAALAQGLVPAVTALLGRPGVQVAHCITVERRLPGPVEATAYFVVAEALANIGKHAHGPARVNITDRSDRLVVVVADDGPGGADATGDGLAGLADRVHALGGRFHVESAPGRGTTIGAELPVGR